MLYVWVYIIQTTRWNHQLLGTHWFTKLRNNSPWIYKNQYTMPGLRPPGSITQRRSSWPTLYLKWSAERHCFGLPGGCAAEWSNIYLETILINMHFIMEISYPSREKGQAKLLRPIDRLFYTTVWMMELNTIKILFACNPPIHLQ